MLHELKSPTEVIFFWSIIFHQDSWNEFEILNKILQLIPHRANGALSSPWYPTFNPLLSYYSKEMGSESSLKRFFVHYPTTLDRDLLTTFKLKTVQWEKETSRPDQTRTFNIDTGFVALEQLVLATSKPYTHRIYIAHGIYADLVFTYQNKNYQSLPWTYPDYQEQAKINYFLSLRKMIASR